MNRQQANFLQEVNLPLYLLLEAEEVHSDDEPLPQDNEEPQPVQEEQPQPTEEEMFQMEKIGTEDKFVQFILYDKLSDLSNKIKIIKENMQIKNEQIDNLFSVQLDQYLQYIDVLNELIFSVSTNTIYNIVGQLEIELIELFKNYLKILENSPKEI